MPTPKKRREKEELKRARKAIKQALRRNKKQKKRL
jgi:hypothetical protein